MLLNCLDVVVVHAIAYYYYVLAKAMRLCDLMNRRQEIVKTTAIRRRIRETLVVSYSGGLIDEVFHNDGDRKDDADWMNDVRLIVVISK